eukprot:TRINITY_DN1131_c0_g4_i1.p1 TRINITY_DN1131_c0_g4~~TRINITY_DN1131_c0_g4_i1.p1  ORF type:complete len:321 (+),score=30.62 TRINITY_DN1131_c0_g4_i1:68-964(+)
MAVLDGLSPREDQGISFSNLGVSTLADSDVHQAGVAEDFILKVLLLGDSGVGKTTLVSQFVRSAEPSLPTIGVSFCSRVIDAAGYSVRLQLWDTAGREEYQCGRSVGDRVALYRYTACVVLVYDVTDRASFRNVTKRVSELHVDVKHLVAVLIATKTNRPVATHAVTSAEGRQLASSRGWLFFEPTGREDIDAAFVAAAQSVISRLGVQPRPAGSISVSHRSADPLRLLPPPTRDRAHNAVQPALAVVLCVAAAAAASRLELRSTGGAPERTEPPLRGGSPEQRPASGSPRCGCCCVQ